MRFIASFTEERRADLRKHLTKRGLLNREKQRFSAILLSSQEKMKISELSKLFNVSPNTIKSWFNKYESLGCCGLLDGNMSHKKSSLSTVSPEIIISSVLANPQNMKAVVANLEVTHEVKTNPSILRRYLKKKNTVGEDLENH